MIQKILYNNAKTMTQIWIVFMDAQSILYTVKSLI